MIAERCLTELMTVVVPCVPTCDMQEQALTYSVGRAVQPAEAYAGMGPVIVVVLEDSISF